MDGIEVFFRILLIILLIVVIVFVILTLLILVAYILYPREYFRRGLIWGIGGLGAQITDYEKFPYRMLKNIPPPFYFKKELNESLVSSIFCKQKKIKNLEEFLISTGTTAFIVIQNDTILYEKYFNGHTRDSIETSFSCAKSFASALIGIAIDEGHINSVNDPITWYLPELMSREPNFELITIRHLLMMSSGIKYREFPWFNGDNAKTYYYPDLRKLALNMTKIKRTPMQRFLYNNYHPLLIGMILERTTKKSVSEYLEEKIWALLGMEFKGSWSIDSNETEFEKMESGINARAIDFAKFGRLFLNDGNWNGNQVISKNWIDESTQIDDSLNWDEFYGKHKFFENKYEYYKYFWWGYTRDENDYDFAAMGNRGQFIYICPQKILIIVRNGKKYGVKSKIWEKAFYDFATEI